MRLPNVSTVGSNLFNSPAGCLSPTCLGLVFLVGTGGEMMSKESFLL